MHMKNVSPQEIKNEVVLRAFEDCRECVLWESGEQARYVFRAGEFFVEDRCVEFEALSVDMDDAHVTAHGDFVKDASQRELCGARDLWSKKYGEECCATLRKFICRRISLNEPSSPSSRS